MGHKIDSDKFLKDIENGKFKERRMVTVTDNWFPCWDGNQVLLYISIIHFSREKDFRVKMSAWGADDTGVALEVTTYSQVEAISLYNHWKKYIFDVVPDGCDMKWFFEHGFYMD